MVLGLLLSYRSSLHRMRCNGLSLRTDRSFYLIRCGSFTSLLFRDSSGLCQAPFPNPPLVWRGYFNPHKFLRNTLYCTRPVNPAADAASIFVPMTAKTMVNPNKSPMLHNPTGQDVFAYSRSPTAEVFCTQEKVRLFTASLTERNVRQGLCCKPVHLFAAIVRKT